MKPAFTAYRESCGATHANGTSGQVGRIGRGDAAAANESEPRTGARGSLSILGEPQLLTPPAVRPEMMRRWNSSTMITSGTVTIVPAAMIAV